MFDFFFFFFFFSSRRRHSRSLCDWSSDVCSSDLEVRRKVQELGSQLPTGVQLQIVHDISDFIKASVHSLLEHLVLGSVLASFIVWIFIRNWRAVLIAAIAIPASVISTFTLMRAMDFSLNNMTLLALTLAVGIVLA